MHAWTVKRGIFGGPWMHWSNFKLGAGLGVPFKSTSNVSRHTIKIFSIFLGLKFDSLINLATRSCLHTNFFRSIKFNVGKSEENLGGKQSFTWNHRSWRILCFYIYYTITIISVQSWFSRGWLSLPTIKMWGKEMLIELAVIFMASKIVSFKIKIN